MGHPSGAIRVEFLGQVLAHDPGTQKSLTHSWGRKRKFFDIGDFWMIFGWDLFLSVLVGDFWKLDLEKKTQEGF